MCLNGRKNRGNVMLRHEIKQGDLRLVTSQEQRKKNLMLSPRGIEPACILGIALRCSSELQRTLWLVKAFYLTHYLPRSHNYFSLLSVKRFSLC